MKEEIQKKKLEKKESELYNKYSKIRTQISDLDDRIAIENFKGCIGKYYKNRYNHDLTRVDSVDTEKQIINVTTLSCSIRNFWIRKETYTKNSYFWTSNKEIDKDVFNKLYQRALNKMEKWQ